MIELNLKDEFENKDEISNFKSTKSQVINNSSNPIGICNPRHILGNGLGLHIFLGKIDRVDMISWLQGFYY